MPNPRLPLITRLSLTALGTIEGGRVREPVDAVAQWTLKEHPDLRPRGIAPDAYSTIRARTALVDRMIAEEAHMARKLGRRICLVAVGPGLDARWRRVVPRDSDVITSYREFEDTSVLSFKERLLNDSPYEHEWSGVERTAFAFNSWDLQPTPGAFPLVVMEGVAGRLTPDALRGLLRTMRMMTPDARLILALPGYGASEPVRWSNGTLRSIGWDPEEDILLGPRHRLSSITGDGVCPGMYPQRVLRLRAGLIPLRHL